MLLMGALWRVRLGYSGIRIYSGIYSGYSAPRGRIAGMGIQVFRNENSSQTKAYSHYSNYSYSGLIPNERTLNLFAISNKQAYIINGNIPVALRCVTFFSQTSQDLSTINNFVDVLSHEQCEGRHVKGTDCINFRGFRPS